MIDNEFIDQYAKLNQNYQSGWHIWKLCEMSAYVVSPRGTAEDEVLSMFKAIVPQEKDETKRLADGANCDTDTIGRRAFAWRARVRFYNCSPLVDANGEEIDYTHREICDRLSYSHFVAVGQYVENNGLDAEQAAVYLVEAVRNRQSRDKMVAAIKEFTDDPEAFRRDWKRLRKSLKTMMRWPHVTGRALRIIRELLSTDLLPR